MEEKRTISLRKDRFERRQSRRNDIRSRHSSHDAHAEGFHRYEAVL
jgi:hypothetical protein